MKSLVSSLLLLLASSLHTAALAQDKNHSRLQASTQVLAEFSKMKEKIPVKLFSIAEGFIVIPSMKNVGLVVAGKRGNGIATIKLANGSWSDTIFRIT